MCSDTLCFCFCFFICIYEAINWLKNKSEKCKQLPFCHDPKTKWSFAVDTPIQYAVVITVFKRKASEVGSNYVDVSWLFAFDFQSAAFTSK